MELRVQHQERAGIKEKQGQAEEEEDALEIALAAVAEDHDHPEEHQERSGGEPDQADVGKGVHLDWMSRSSKSYAAR